MSRLPNKKYERLVSRRYEHNPWEDLEQIISDHEINTGNPLEENMLFSFGVRNIEQMTELQAETALEMMRSNAWNGGDA